MRRSSKRRRMASSRWRRSRACTEWNILSSARDDVLSEQVDLLRREGWRFLLTSEDFLELVHLQAGLFLELDYNPMEHALVHVCMSVYDKDDAMAQFTTHRYIVTDDRILSGEPIIGGTRTPVRAIVELWRQGVIPESIPSRLPHLTLAQVFDALSYYSDHQDDINAAIERNRISDDLIDPLLQPT
jgi:uncharacterized protein (DUF433 family)